MDTRRLFLFGLLVLIPCVAEAAAPTPPVRCSRAPSLRACREANRQLEEADKLRRARKRAKALAAYARAAELLPESAVPCVRAASMFLDLRDPAKLLELSTCAITREPRRPMPHLFAGVAHQALGNEQQAAAAYETYARLSPRAAFAEDAALVSQRLRAASACGDAGVSDAHPGTASPAAVAPRSGRVASRAAWHAE